jgi:hypothetical protein
LARVCRYGVSTSPANTPSNYSISWGLEIAGTVERKANACRGDVLKEYLKLGVLASCDRPGLGLEPSSHTIGLDN